VGVSVRPSVVTLHAAGRGFELHLLPRLQVALEGTFHMTTVIPRFTLALLVRLIL